MANSKPDYGKVWGIYNVFSKAWEIGPGGIPLHAANPIPIAMHFKSRNIINPDIKVAVFPDQLGGEPTEFFEFAEPADKDKEKEKEKDAGPNANFVEAETKPATTPGKPSVFGGKGK